MNEIYRLRPANLQTIEELNKPYLWFSRPTEYKDIDDANMIVFLESNETVKELFKKVFRDTQHIGEEVGRLGICCFTKSLPDTSKWKIFPKGHNSIFIEYDKKVLEEYFLSKYYLGDCFKNVRYKKDPIILQSSTQEGNDVLWEETKDGKHYKSLRGEIERDQKLMEKFAFLFFTTININFSEQKEVRIILPYRLINLYPLDVKGYEIIIPFESIKKIYYNKYTDERFLDDLQQLGYLIEEK